MSIVAIYAGIAGFVYVCFIAGIAVAVLRNTKEPYNNGYPQQRGRPVVPGEPPLPVNGLPVNEQPVNGSSRGETALGAAAAATAAATADTELGAAAAAAAAVASMTPTAKDGTDNKDRNNRLVLYEHNSKEEANIGAAAAVAAAASLANEVEEVEEGEEANIEEAAAVAAAASLANIKPLRVQAGGTRMTGAGALSAFLPHCVIKIVRLLVWRKAMKQDNGVGTLRVRTFLTDALFTFVAIAALDILRPPGVDDRFVVDAALDYVLSIGLIVAYSLISIRHALEDHILNALITMPYFLITAFNNS